MLGDIEVIRAYDPPDPSQQGHRVLIDRMWPRGIKKEKLAIDPDRLRLQEWNKDVAPSTGLRQWFGHDPGKWETFKQRYAAELEADQDAWRPLLEAARRGKLTLVYSAKDEHHNNAVFLRQFLLGKLSAEAGSGGALKKAHGRSVAGTKVARGRGSTAKKNAVEKPHAVSGQHRGRAAAPQRREE